ncbi:MAG: DUF1667 domain-containing protein [Clostridia bacterium]|nr:DUF1667 domain-containing protein [Clostridia bacterium]
MKKYTCILCPVSCEMEAGQAVDHGEISVSGNACKRGEVYARMEIINPQRILTTLFPVTRGKAVPCKSGAPLDNHKLFDVIKLIKNSRAQKPVKAGDILLPNVLGTGVDIIATADRP